MNHPSPAPYGHAITTAEIATLRVENARLRAALEPFAKVAEHIAAHHPGWNHDGFQFLVHPLIDAHFPSFAAFRRARIIFSTPAVLSTESRQDG